MKRILLLVLVLLPFLARSQNYSWKFFDRYSDASGFTSVQLERKMMRMMSRQAAEQGDKKLAELLDGIQYIRIVALDRGAGAQLRGGDIYYLYGDDAEQLAADPDARFELVMSGTEQGQTTKFYLREAEFNLNSELLMLTYGPRETVAVNIYGNFDLKQVSRLSSIRPRKR